MKLFKDKRVSIVEKIFVSFVTVVMFLIMVWLLASLITSDALANPIEYLYNVARFMGFSGIFTLGFVLFDKYEKLKESRS